MSVTGSAISDLATLGLTGYEISQGQPVSINQTTVGGVPATSVSVGSIFSGTSGTLIVVAAVIVAGLVLFYILKR